MIHFACSGKNLEEILDEVRKRIMADDESVSTSTNSDKVDEDKSYGDKCYKYREDISKCWWVTLSKDSDGDSQIVTYYIIAPFLIKDSFKASITVGPDHQEYLDVVFDNNTDQLNTFEHKNFNVGKHISLKFSACAPNFKVIKKGIKTSYSNGVISVSIPSEKPKSKKDSEFIFGLN